MAIEIPERELSLDDKLRGYSRFQNYKGQYFVLEAIKQKISKKSDSEDLKIVPYYNTIRGPGFGYALIQGSGQDVHGTDEGLAITPETKIEKRLPSRSFFDKIFGIKPREIEAEVYVPKGSLLAICSGYDRLAIFRENMELIRACEDIAAKTDKPLQIIYHF